MASAFCILLAFDEGTVAGRYWSNELDTQCLVEASLGRQIDHTRTMDETTFGFRYIMIALLLTLYELQSQCAIFAVTFDKYRTWLVIKLSTWSVTSRAKVEGPYIAATCWPFVDYQQPWSRSLRGLGILGKGAEVLCMEGAVTVRSYRKQSRGASQGLCSARCVELVDMDHCTNHYS